MLARGWMNAMDNQVTICRSFRRGSRAHKHHEMKAVCISVTGLARDRTPKGCVADRLNTVTWTPPVCVYDTRDRLGVWGLVATRGSMGAIFSAAFAHGPPRTYPRQFLWVLVALGWKMSLLAWGLVAHGPLAARRHLSMRSRGGVRELAPRSRRRLAGKFMWQDRAGSALRASLRPESEVISISTIR